MTYIFLRTACAMNRTCPRSGVSRPMSTSTIHILHLGTATRTADGRAIAALEYFRRLDVSRQPAEMKHSLAIVRRRRQPVPWADTAARLGVPVYDLVRYAPGDFTLFWRLARLARKLSVDVVHAHDAGSRCLALLLQPVVGFRIVATAAGWSGTTWRQRITAGVDQKLLPGFDRIIAANNQLARDLCMTGCRPQQIDVIHGGVDTETFSRKNVRGHLRAELGLSPADRVVGVHAESATRDELEGVLEAIRFAQSEVGPLHALVFGAECPADGLEAAFGWNILEGRLHTIGVHGELPEVYAALDALVLPQSATANALFEAQSMEVPVIAVGPSGIGELIENGTTGILLEDDSPLSLGAAVARMLADDRGSASLAAAGRLRICQRFRFDDLLLKVAGTYRRACAQA